MYQGYQHISRQTSIECAVVWSGLNYLVKIDKDGKLRWAGNGLVDYRALERLWKRRRYNSSGCSPRLFGTPARQLRFGVTSGDLVHLVESSYSLYRRHTLARRTLVGKALKSHFIQNRRRWDCGSLPEFFREWRKTYFKTLSTDLPDNLMQDVVMLFGDSITQGA